MGYVIYGLCDLWDINHLWLLMVIVYIWFEGYNPMGFIENIDVLMRLIYHNCYIQGFNIVFFLSVDDDWWGLIMYVYWYNEALGDSNQSWAQWGILIKWLVKIS